MRTPLTTLLIACLAAPGFSSTGPGTARGGLAPVAAPVSPEPALHLPWREAGWTTEQAAAHLVARFSFGARVRVKTRSDLRRYDVSMRLSVLNRNYLGTHFGGSLYAMCDPFFVLILIQALGPGFVVWDKAASIRFRRPGRGRVRASFEIPEERIEAIRREAEAAGPIEPVFEVDVVDEEGKVVATVEKVLYVRRRDAARPA